MNHIVPRQARLEVRVKGEFVSILDSLGVSVALCSYRSNLLLLASPHGGRMSFQPCSFEKPMALSAQRGTLALAARTTLVQFAASTALAPGFPLARERFDRLWLPRALHFTGELDLHDLAHSADGLLGLATRFSCLARLDAAASFTPLWQPPFVSALLAEDRCHLNGLALDAGGRPCAVTMLGAADTPEGWRANRVQGGVLMRVPDGRVLLDGLCMPHSPRCVADGMLVLNSGAGEVLHLPPAGGTPRVLARLAGYARGLCVHGDLLFVGLSRLRDRRGAGHAPLPVEQDGAALSCGVAVLDRRTGRVLGEMLLEGDVDEISDLALLPGAGRHGLVSHTDPIHSDALALPDRGFWAVPAAPAP